jgi:hypothetical protein
MSHTTTSHTASHATTSLTSADWVTRDDMAALTRKSADLPSPSALTAQNGSIRTLAA